MGEAQAAPIVLPSSCYERAVAQARADGGKILTEGRRTDGDCACGYFVEPTVIDGLPASHPLLNEDPFVPITREQNRVRIR